MKCAVEMALCGIIYIPSFMKTGSAIEKLTGRICIQTHSQQGDLKNLFLFYFILQNKESKLKRMERKKCFLVRTYIPAHTTVSLLCFTH
jgi:hypothetical protein